MTDIYKITLDAQEALKGFDKLIDKSKELTSKIKSIQAQINQIKNKTVTIDIKVKNDSVINKVSSSIKELKSKRINLSFSLGNELKTLQKDLKSLKGRALKLSIEYNKQTFKNLSNQIKSLRGKKITLFVDVDKKQLNTLQSTLNSLHAKKIRITTTINKTKIDTLESQLSKLHDKKLHIKLSADTKEATQFKNTLNQLKNKSVKIGLDYSKQNFKNLSSLLKNLREKKIFIKAEVDNKQLTELKNLLKSLTDKKIRLDIVTSEAGIKKVKDKISSLHDKKVDVDVKVKNESRVDNLLKKISSLSSKDIKLNISSAGFDKLNDGIKKLNSTLINFVGLHTVQAQTRSTIKDFKDLELQIAGVAKTTNLSGKDLNELVDSLREMSKTQNSMDIAKLYEIAEGAGQLGIKGKDNILRFTRSIRELSATSKLTAEQAGTEFAKLSTVLQIPMTDIDNLTSAFTKLASTTTTDEKKLIKYVQRLSGMAKTFGLTNQQIIGMSATLADLGVNAELSTTAMSRVFNKMLSNTKRITEVLKLDFDDFSNALRNEPIKAVNMFLQRLSQLDKQNVVEALNEMRLSSTGATQTILKLSQSFGKLQTNIRTTEDAYKKGTATSREFAIVQNTLDGANQRLISNYKDMNYQLGKALKPTLVTVINVLSNLSSFVGNNAKVFTTLAVTLGTATIAFKGLNLVMSLSPFGRVVAGITAITTAVTYAIGKIRELYNTYKKNSERLKEYTSKEAVALRKRKKAIDDYTKALKYQQSLQLQINRLNSSFKSAINDSRVREAKAYQHALENLGKEWTRNTYKIQKFKKEVPKTLRTSVKVDVHVNRPKLPHYRIDYTPPTVRVVNHKLTSNFANKTTNQTYNKPKPLNLVPKIDYKPINNFINKKRDFKVSPKVDSKPIDYFMRKSRSVPLSLDIDRTPINKLSNQAIPLQVSISEKIDNSVLEQFIKDNDKRILHLKFKLDKTIDKNEKKYLEEELQNYIDSKTLNRSEILKKELDKEIELYKKAGIEKEKIDEYFRVKYQEVLHQRQKEYANEQEERRKKALEEINRQLAQYKKNTVDLSKLDIGKIFSDSFKRAGLGDKLNGIFSDVSMKFTQDLIKGIEEYANSGKLSETFKNGLGGVLQTIGVGDTSNDSETEKYGKGFGSALGGIAGAFFGNPQIGIGIGTIIGGVVGRAVHGFFKKDNAYTLDQLKEERQVLQDKIKVLQEQRVVVHGLSIYSKDFANLYENMNKSLRERNNQRTPQNQIGFEGIGLQKDYKSLQEAFTSYADANRNNTSYMGIINLAIARNKALEAGLNISSQRELTADGKQNDENLKKMNDRLKTIEQLLDHQNNIQAKIEENTYKQSI